MFVPRELQSLSMGNNFECCMWHMSESINPNLACDKLAGYHDGTWCFGDFSYKYSVSNAIIIFLQELHLKGFSLWWVYQGSRFIMWRAICRWRISFKGNRFHNVSLQLIFSFPWCLCRSIALQSIYQNLLLKVNIVLAFNFFFFCLFSFPSVKHRN